MAAFGGRGCRRLAAEMPVFTGGNKRGQGHRMVPLPPLDSPKPSFALTHRRCAAKRGLGSVRRFAFGTLSDPEFTLSQPPRITVRGHSVQGGSVPLRKAPLRSSVYSWSTKRPCGPLAFRRATEGSRVSKEGQGSQEGTGNHVWCPVPFCPCRWAPTLPAAGRRQCPVCLSAALSSPPPAAPLYRRKVCRLLQVKRKKLRLRRQEY